MHVEKLQFFSLLNFLLFIPIIYTLIILFLLHVFKMSTLLGYFWEIMHLGHSRKKKKGTKNRSNGCIALWVRLRYWTDICLLLLPHPKEVQWWEPSAWCSAMLFISETPPDTFSSRRRSGGVHGTLERTVRGPLAWTVSELSRAQSKDVPDGHKLELCRENNVFLAFLKGHVVLFFFGWKQHDRKERKGGGRSRLCTVCPYTLQKSAILTIYRATL